MIIRTQLNGTFQNSETFIQRTETFYFSQRALKLHEINIIILNDYMTLQLSVFLYTEVNCMYVFNEYVFNICFILL